MFSVVGRTLTYTICNKNYIFLKTFENHLEALSKCASAVQNKRLKYTFKPLSQRNGPQPSRYHPGSYIESAEDRIMSNLNSMVSMTAKDWDDYKINLMTDIELITEQNFTSIMMNCLLGENKLDLAHSFLNYLENSNLKPNFVTYLKYIALCGRNHRQVSQELILKNLIKVQAFLDSRPVLDMKTTEYTIQGLCATHKWQESFEYLKKLTQKPTLEIRNSIACAAIRNGDEALAWEILTKWIKEGEAPSDTVIEEFLLVALEMLNTDPRKSDIFIKKILQYMQTKDIVVSQDVVKYFGNYFTCHRSKWDISYTKVSRKGVCEKCGHVLKLSDLTDKEFMYLQRAFLERVVQKSDVFINSTEREFNNYINFIEKYKPFHVIIDGLNAAYTYPYVKSRKTLSSHLLKITKILAGKSRKLLVLGRQHMKEWPTFCMEKISHKAKVFFTDNISQDDPFTIYAALASGPHTFILSDDLMRDHISRLDDPEIIQLFRRWQQSHQMFITVDENNFIKFIEPVGYSIHAQGSMDWGWHIPYDDKIELDPYEELNNWLCVRRCYE